MNDFLRALAERRQFIVYRLQPGQYGGTDKIPIDPLSGLPINAQDPANWLLPAEALAHAQLNGERHGVGIVIYEGCGIACIDIDHCLMPGGKWSEHSHRICGRFPGAAVEISQSGESLHVFFSYTGTIAPHRTKDTANHVELYTRLRFIALTFNQMTGDVLTDHTAALLWTLAEYFPPAMAADAEAEWTTEPRAEWAGPEDDAELIKIMLAARGSPHAIFGKGVTLAKLWTADVDALAAAFPTQNNHDPFDRSSADQALFNHLAFYTGSDCERMLRLARQSALARDKWDRPDYIGRTVVRSASECKTWYARGVDRKPAAPPAPALAVEVALTPLEPEPAIGQPETHGRHNFPLGDYLTGDMQRELFADCVYIRDVHMVLCADGDTLTQDRFNADFGGFNFIGPEDGTKPGKSAWDAFVHSHIVEFPKVHAATFMPTAAPREVLTIEGRTFVNTWVPIEVAKRTGDPGPFLEHVRKLIPDDRDRLIALSYFAGLVQYPGRKARWALFIQGVEGNGKSWLSTIVTYCVGRRYTHPARASQIDSRFNSTYYQKLLITVEDMYTSDNRRSTWEAVKPMITEEYLEVESKGVDRVMRYMPFNMILNSNHKDAVPKTDNDRRVAPIFTPQQHKSHLARDGLTSGYFQRLKRWLETEDGYAICAHFLSTFVIPPEFDFTKDAIVAPETTSLTEAVTSSRGAAEQEIDEAVSEGRAGFRGGWISSVALHNLLVETRKAHLIPRNRRRDVLRSMGYDIHPGLPDDGRAPVPLADGSRPRLFVTGAHPTVGRGLSPAEIAAAYSAAQGLA